jgi:hypothetical protein
MHHYTRHTAASITVNNRLQKLWVEFTPEIAINFPWLTQGMLTLSALHLAYLRPEESSIWLPLSFKHQNAAIAAFREVIPTINEHNCDALFALASIISVASMAWSSRVGLAEVLTVQDIIEPFYLTRGVGEVVGVASEWIRAGPMGTLLYGHSVPADKVELPEDTAQDFHYLREMIQQDCTGEDVRNIILEAHSQLEGIYREVIFRGPRIKDEFGAVWKFAAMSSNEFIALLREENPYALLLYARFSILSSSLQEKWCLEGWPDRSLRAISAAIEPQLSDWMKWPERQLRDGLSILQHFQQMDIDPSLQWCVTMLAIKNEGY